MIVTLADGAMDLPERLAVQVRDLRIPTDECPGFRHLTCAEAARMLIAKHYGPGPHPGTGTEQSVHGGGAPDQAPAALTPAQASVLDAIRTGKAAGGGTLFWAKVKDPRGRKPPEDSFHGQLYLDGYPENPRMWLGWQPTAATVAALERRGLIRRVSLPIPPGAVGYAAYGMFEVAEPEVDQAPSTPAAPGVHLADHPDLEVTPALDARLDRLLDRGEQIRVEVAAALTEAKPRLEEMRRRMREAAVTPGLERQEESRLSKEATRATNLAWFLMRPTREGYLEGQAPGFGQVLSRVQMDYLLENLSARELIPERAARDVTLMGRSSVVDEFEIPGVVRFKGKGGLVVGFMSGAEGGEKPYLSIRRIGQRARYSIEVLDGIAFAKLCRTAGIETSWGKGYEVKLLEAIRTGKVKLSAAKLAEAPLHSNGVLWTTDPDYTTGDASGPVITRPEDALPVITAGLEAGKTLRDSSRYSTKNMAAAQAVGDAIAREHAKVVLGVLSKYRNFGPGPLIPGRLPGKRKVSYYTTAHKMYEYGGAKPIIIEGRRAASDVKAARVESTQESLDQAVEALGFFPTDWFDEATRRAFEPTWRDDAYIALVVDTRPAGYRAQYWDSRRQMSFGTDDRLGDHLHEVAHFLEHSNPVIQQMERAYHQRRTTTPDGVREKIVSRSFGSRSQENYRPDRYTDKYIGREYGRSSEREAYELLSMGWPTTVTGQSYGSGDHRFGADPEFDAFILGLITEPGL